MAFRITGLDPTPFRPLFVLDDHALAARGAARVRADASPGYPDRISLTDAAPGDTLLLINHVHLPGDTPYRASHAIYVNQRADRAYDAVDTIPPALRVRLLSLRAFDARDWLLDADVVDGADAAQTIERLLAHPQAAYVHAHYAKPGCYAARIVRAPPPLR